MPAQPYSAVSRYRLLPDGSIDHAFYRAAARRRRRLVQARALVAIVRPVRGWFGLGRAPRQSAEGLPMRASAARS